jgi:hypothetical protein
MGANQVVSNTTQTKLVFDTERFDTASCFNTATYRFTPTVAGYYNIIAVASMSETTASSRMVVSIFKNGTNYITGNSAAAGAATFPSSTASSLVNFNGTTDYVEAYVYVDAGAPKTIFADASWRSEFSGCLVRSAT